MPANARISQADPQAAAWTMQDSSLLSGSAFPGWLPVSAWIGVGLRVSIAIGRHVLNVIARSARIAISAKR